MNWADISIIVLILLSVVFGIFRGFVKETLSLLSWFLAGWASITFSPEFSPMLSRYLTTPSVRIVCAFIILFIVTLFAASLLSNIVVHMIHKIGLNSTDRTLGIVFGALRGVLIVATLILLLSFTPALDDPWWKQSTLIPYFTPVVDFLHDVIEHGIIEKK
jgi:membrane protein required for colicin V production